MCLDILILRFKSLSGKSWCCYHGEQSKMGFVILSFPPFLGTVNLHSSLHGSSGAGIANKVFRVPDFFVSKLYVGRNACG